MEAGYETLILKQLMRQVLRHETVSKHEVMRWLKNESKTMVIETNERKIRNDLRICESIHDRSEP